MCKYKVYSKVMVFIFFLPLPRFGRFGGRKSVSTCYSVQFCAAARAPQFPCVDFSEHVRSAVEAYAGSTFLAVEIGAVNNLLANYARFT